MMMMMTKGKNLCTFAIPSSPIAMDAFTFTDLTVTLRDGAVVLDAVSGAVTAGRTLAILGPSGAGKTTLLLALAGRLPARGGLALTGAIAPPPCPAASGFVFQEDALCAYLSAREVRALSRGSGTARSHAGTTKRHERMAHQELTSHTRKRHHHVMAHAELSSRDTTSHHHGAHGFSRHHTSHQESLPPTTHNRCASRSGSRRRCARARAPRRAARASTRWSRCATTTTAARRHILT